jgi:hypothetical protein
MLIRPTRKEMKLFEHVRPRKADDVAETSLDLVRQEFYGDGPLRDPRFDA